MRLCSILGASTVAATRSAPLVLAATASPPSLACLPALSGGKVAMTFSWAEADGKLAPSLLLGTSRDPRQLRLPAGTLAAQTTYTFVVTCAMTQYPERVNTARVVVVVGSQALVARIAGGAQTQVKSI